MKTSIPSIHPILGAAREIWWRGALLALLVLIALAGPVVAPSRGASAAPPDSMTYQGFLVDANGNALAPTTPQNFPVVFRIYSVASGAGAPLWSEQQIVTVDKGNFSVVLGEGTALGGELRPALSSVFSGATASDRFIGISVTIGGTTTEILPRLRLLPSPYSFLATGAANLVQPNGANAISYANNRVEVTGNLFASGTVAGTFAGNGAGLTDLNASQLTSGLLSDARLSGNVIRGNAANTFAQNQTFSGSVGIGTSPGARLDVLSSTGSRLRVFDFGGGNGGQLVGGWAANSPNGPQVRYERVGAPGFWDVGMINGDFFIEESDIPRLTLRAGGNVGIGTTGPVRPLHINTGEAVATRIDSSSVIGTWLALGNSSAGGRYWQFISSGSGNGEGAGKLLIGTGSSDGSTSPKMTLTDNGNVGVNTSTPADMLHVRGGVFRVDDGGGEYIRMYRSANGLILSGNGMGNPAFGGGIGQIQWDGDANWDNFSDRRLKKDITAAEPVLDRLMKLEVRRYRWKEAGEDSAKKFGVIAQEVQPLFPESVGTMEQKDSNEEYLTVKYGTFGLIAVKALQELKAEKDSEQVALKQQIEELKQEVATLKARQAQSARVDTLQDEVASLKQIVQQLAAASQKSGKLAAPQAGVPEGAVR